jgi:drug/metabolite transporter (DMT)-like permease
MNGSSKPSAGENRFLAYLAMLVTAAIWAIAGPVIKVTLQDVPPFTFLALRFLINTIVISPILWLYLRKHPREIPRSAGEVGRLFLLTLLGTTLTLALIFLGIDRTTAIDATLIIATTPIFIVLGGSLICIKGVVCLREKVTRLEKIGLAVAVLGVGVTVVQPLLESGIFASENLIGNFLVLISNLTWTGFTLLSKETYRRFSPFLVTAASFIFGFLTFLPLALIEGSNLLTIVYQLPTTAILGVLYMSLLSSIVAYFTYAWGVSKIEASEAALFLYLEPIIAAPFAYWWLGEKITTTFLIGAAVIAAGVIITEYRPRRNT